MNHSLSRCPLMAGILLEDELLIFIRLMMQYVCTAAAFGYLMECPSDLRYDATSHVCNYKQLVSFHSHEVLEDDSAYEMLFMHNSS